MQTNLDAVREKMRNWTHYHQGYQLYTFTMPVTWDHAQDRPYRGDTLRGGHWMYLHLYYSPDRALEDEKAFNLRLVNLHKELESGERHPDHEKQYAKFFEVKSTPVRGAKVLAKEDAIAEAKRNDGYFALMSNEIKDPVEALSIYRRKMQENNLFTDCTLQEALDKPDIIECFEVPGQKRQVGEMTKHQMDLFSKLGAAPPISLQ